MQAVINAVNIVRSIFILIGTGMYLTWRNRLNDQNSPLISHLVVRVALPGTIIANLFGSFTAESMRECLRTAANTDTAAHSRRRQLFRPPGHRKQSDDSDRYPLP